MVQGANFKFVGDLLRSGSIPLTGRKSGLSFYGPFINHVQLNPPIHALLT